MNEEIKWNDLKDWEEQYLISNTGIVKSKERLAKSNWGNMRIVKSKILSLTNSNGYKNVTLSRNGTTKFIGIHILVALQFVPNPENKEEVNHRDGNKNNNDSSNLEWATHLENMQHAYKNGLANSKGINNPQAKISEKSVLEIRKQYIEGIKQSVLAKQYCLSPSTIYDIIKRKIWRHI